MLNTIAPAHNKILQTQKAKTTPSRRTGARTRITIMLNKKQKGQTSKVETTIIQLKKNVHQALAVMETDTGKLLNYRQLMRNPKYKKNWSTSSANEFGRLENGFWRTYKNPNQHNHIHHKKRNPKQLQERRDIQTIHLQCVNK